MSLKGQNVHNPEPVTKDGEQQDENIHIHKEPLAPQLQQQHELELKADALSRGFQQSPTTQINRVPKATASEKDHVLKEYYYPKTVSIGPYHYGKEDLKPIQNLKLEFAHDLFSKLEKGKLVDLQAKLGERDMLRKLRGYYEEKSTDEFSDNAFTGMMLLDGCFILYYILLSCGHHFETKQKLSNIQKTSIRRDLFLLENQIPFTVLDVVMNHMKDRCEKDIQQFIVESTFSPRMAGKQPVGGSRSSRANSTSYMGFPDLDPNKCEVHHLLHLLRLNLTKNCNDTTANSSAHDIHPLPTVKELMDARIHFKKNNTTSLCRIEFSEHWWSMSATVKLPPIFIEETSTKYLFLNLMAYEASSHKSNDMWVTSYICLLNSLISKPEDVKALRDAEVFADSQGSDDDILKVIKEMAHASRVPDNLAYLDAKAQIQRYYNGFKGCNIPISEFRDKYFNTPWSFLALVGAILALFLTAVQTYFTVWSPKGECDDLCKFLKMNHHL